MLVKFSKMELPDGSLAMQVWLPNETLALPELGNNPDTKMPKEKRPISSDDSDSGPEDRAPLPKSQKKSLHKVFLNNQMLNSTMFEILNLEMEW